MKSESKSKDRKPDDRIIEITPDVKWIGVLDYDIVTFDIVMETEFGTTYNSYFINAEKKAVVEAAKDRFSDVQISKLKKLCDPSEIQYIILDHTEPDHSGNTGRLLELAPDATVVGSGNMIRYLSDIINKPFKSIAVKDGDTLSLGNKTLRFIAAPNLHWPDSIFTWLEEDRVLFTCDMFGAHYCSEEMFNDFSEDYFKSFKYYFDVILRPFSRFALKAIEKIKPLDIRFICPGHGPVHHRDIERIITLTEELSREYVEITSGGEVKNVLIAYVSAYGFTGKMAEIVAEGIKEIPGVKATLLDIENISAGELDKELMKADALLVGSPTINQNTLLPVYRLFAFINPLRDRGKPAGSFGSYGWSGEAPGIIAAALKGLKLAYFENPLTVKFFPGNEKAGLLKEYGRRFGEFVLSQCSGKNLNKE
ncbi:MAG TPA: FprA family A-type flavoprotein [Bacteroidales bacterium]|nr:FprA family A-type flavoprotein [Bacteroidales bacterium]HOK73667.1 FprA family A-type flavoprotein [Bacteroidales bacterium]HOM39337.1 FprA family A-type flavoprotein [Bacteroidales bacterium]HPP91445.1 FprA family A-type flavoprotein [Bacteroidales bacterium]HQG56467.1 FprA family A-type flavoprotein [Bacteroidales bacterium]